MQSTHLRRYIRYVYSKIGGWGNGGGFGVGSAAIGCGESVELRVVNVVLLWSLLCLIWARLLGCVSQVGASFFNLVRGFAFGR